MKSYPSYKDSGIKWIGEIPSHWNLRKLKYCCSVTTGDKDTKDRVDDGLYPFYVRSPNIERINSYSFEGESVLTAGDGVGTGKVFHYVNGKFDFHQRVYKFSHFKEILGKFFYFFINTKFIYVTENQTSKSTVDSLRLPLIQNFLFVIPKIEEQKEIIEYIDHKNQQIDDLIKKTEKKIELLKEKRTSLINHCVTKGLNPDVEMKDSEVEWIGEIPSHWDFVRLNVIGNFSKGKGITKDKIKSNGLPCIRCGEIYTTYNRITSKLVSYIDEETSIESIPGEKRSVLFTGDGETLEEIGKCLVYNGNETIFIGGGINVFFPNESINHIFLSYALNSHYINYQKSREGKGEIVVHIYAKQLKEIRLSLPPISEQKQIVEYLDEQTQKVDSTIEKETQRIELLKEYRQSLISEAVTGKIDVRDWKQ